MSDLFGIIMSVGFTSSYIPQIIRLYRHKTADDVSILLFIQCSVAYLAGFLYIWSINTFEIWLVVNYVVGFFFSAWTTILIAYYRFNDYRRNRQ